MSKYKWIEAKDLNAAMWVRESFYAQEEDLQVSSVVKTDDRVFVDYYIPIGVSLRSSDLVTVFLSWEGDAAIVRVNVEYSLDDTVLVRR